MTKRIGANFRSLGMAALLLGASCGVLFMAGCATSTAVPGGADLVTASDEPEARRRARIRLELAVGYFEQGQTTVALDEVKQALALDPSFAAAFTVRGLIYMRLNDMALSEDSFRRSLALSPGDSDTLHNYAWMLCHMGRHAESDQAFRQAMSNPNYPRRSKTLLAHGLCQVRAGKLADAEQSLERAYELEPGNPVITYNLGLMLFQRGALERAQFHARRLNNSELGNAESFWLGIKIERRLHNDEATQQLATQLRRRFPQSRELTLYERGAFDE